MVFGDWTVIKQVKKDVYLCKCTCGLRKRLSKEDLISNNNKCNHIIPNRKDISNKTFGMWEVIKPTSKGYYLCKCKCGCNTIKEIYGTTLRNGKSKSCGKNTTKFKDLTNMQIGSWKVIEYIGGHMWLCKCKCGTIKEVHSYSLIHNKSISCGCESSDIIINKLISRGYLNSRSEEQLNAIKSKDNLVNFINKLGYKPTIKQLALELGLSESWAIKYVHRYNIEKDVLIHISKSTYEIEIANFIKNECTCDIVIGDRTILKGKELDIYIPEKKLAIEFNGTYWHSELYKDKYYHQDKTLECRKQGIRLIHIFEFEYITKEKQEKLKQFLSNILNEDKKIIDADSIEIYQCSHSDAVRFLNKNHLYGYKLSLINIACKYNNEIVAIITFNNIKINDENHYELIQLCYKNGYSIIDGADIMLSYFVNTFNPKSIITYINTGKFTEDIYLKMGFKNMQIDKVMEPNYFLVNQKTDEVIHVNYNEENDLIDLNRYNEAEYSEYLKLYDSGNIKLEYKPYK